MSPVNVICWVLDGFAFVLGLIGYWGFIHRANRIRIPEFIPPPLDPEHGFSPHLWQDTMDRHMETLVERLDKRVALRERGMPWLRTAMAVAAIALALALGNIAWLVVT